MKERQFTDEQLKVLAGVFHVDTGDAFKEPTEEELAAKVEEVFPKAERDEIAAKLSKQLEEYFFPGRKATK